MLSAFGGSAMVQWFFAAVSIAGFFYALLFLPETHGKKLSEIEAYFSGEDKKKKKTEAGSSAKSKETESMLQSPTTA